MIQNVLIFGCGNIGSRHLQGIVKSKFTTNIYIVEKNITQINIAKKRIREVKNNNNKIFFFKDLKFKKKKFDLAILSTTSSKRLFFINKLIKYKIIKNLIIEKVAFQNKEDFYKAKKTLDKKKINSFVNCPRRRHHIYRLINRKINKNKKIILHVKGNQWNMASNLIHFLDLFLFLSNRKNNDFIYSKIKYKKILNSKRNNFFEVKGRIELNNKLGDKIIFEDHNKNKKELVVKIINFKNEFIINETKLNAKIINKHSKSKIINKLNFKIPLQGELSSFYQKEINSKKGLNIPSLTDSYCSHIILFDIMKKQFNLYNVKRKKIFFPIS